MTHTEMMERLETLQTYSFLLDMKDRWTHADYDEHDRMFAEILQLKRALHLLEDPTPQAKVFEDREPTQEELEIWSEPVEVIECGMKIRQSEFLGYMTVEEWKAKRRAEAGV